MDKNRKSEKMMLPSAGVLAVLCAAGTAVGTFADHDISDALYDPGSIPWRVFTILGMYPFMALWVFYLGVICRQVRCSGLSKGKKTGWTLVCGYLGLSTSVICSWAMFAVDTIGGVVPELINNPAAITAGALLGVYPLFFAGLFTSKKEYDKRLLKRLIVLCVIMLISLGVLELTKLCFCRPRYRLLIQELPGLGFQPWYLPFSGSGEFITEFGLDWNDFRSFPSGHTTQCIGLIFALPPLAEVYGRLEGKKPVLFAAGAVFGILVAFSRIVMGAHFLSDICGGALIAVVFTFIEYGFVKKKNINM